MINEEKRIMTSKQLKEWLDYELKKYKGNKFFGESAILRKHQILLRKTELYKNTNKKLRFLFYKFRLSRIQNKYCLHIPINTCGKGLKVMHVGPMFINGKAHIGENCSIHVNTAIAARGHGDGVPVLGNGVVVGLGAVILGGVYIADNIAVGANAVVNKSFYEENIVIAGVPAKKISNNGRLSWNNHSQDQ